MLIDLHSENQCGRHTCPWRQPDGPIDIHSRTVITEESAERQGLKDLFHVPHVSLAILASTNHKDGPLSIHTVPSQIARWAVWTVVEFLLTLQFVQSAHCNTSSLFFFNPLRGSREREGAALDADRDITSLHIRCLQSSCRAAIPASLNGAIKNKWGLLEKLPLQQRLITVTLVCSRKRQREEEIGQLATSLAQIGVIQSRSRPRLLTAKSLDSLKMSIINICVWTGGLLQEYNDELRVQSILCLVALKLWQKYAEMKEWTACFRFFSVFRAY